MDVNIKIKKPVLPRAFSVALHQCRLGMDGIHGTGIHASAAVDAGFGVDNTLAPLFADGVHRAGILTCRAIGAIVGNGMGHGSPPSKISLPFGKRYIYIRFPFYCPAKITLPICPWISENVLNSVALYCIYQIQFYFICIHLHERLFFIDIINKSLFI